MSINVEQKIQIYNPSIEYLDIIKTYEYKQIEEEINKVKGTCIIHMIPKMDTYLSDDESDLIGYCDAMMCEIRVFDVDNKIYYKDESLYDNIRIDNINVETRIYKDLSTMYIFTKPTEIMYGWNTLFVEGD